MKTLNKILIGINLFALQAYLIRFQIGNFPTNLQEILILLNTFTFLYLYPFKNFVEAFKKHWIISSFIALTVISVTLVPFSNGLDFVRHLKFLFFALILGFIFVETFKTNADRKSALRIGGIGAIIFGIFCVTYNLLGYNAAYDLRLLGPLDAAVYLAFYFTPFFLFFAISFFENHKDKSNLIYALMLGMLLLATRSMGAIGASVLVLGIYFYKNSELKILKSRVSKIILGILVVAAVAATVYTKILPTLQTEYSSLDERGEIWQTSLYLLSKPENALFGVGYGQFQQQYFLNVEQVLERQPLDFYVLQPHNIFLLFVMQFGLLGLAFIVYCIFSVCRNITRDGDSKTLAGTANYILLYFFIHGLIDTPFFKNDLLILVILFMELALVREETIFLKIKKKVKKALKR
ncbi:MAG: O-antigen ligase family protein [Patescibacteria group bacterium]